MPIVNPAAEAHVRPTRQPRATEVPERGVDSHLRSSREVIGYHVEASDAALGHVEDSIFDEKTWAIRHVVVNTGNWLPGEHVLISSIRIRSVSWAERSVFVDMRRSAVRKNSLASQIVRHGKSGSGSRRTLA